MCNLYNITTNQEAIRQFIGIMEDRVGNLEPSLDLYPDRPAPVVRNDGNGVRELTKLTWGHADAQNAAEARCSRHRRDQRPQDMAAALAALARCRKSLRRAGDRVLRVPPDARPEDEEEAEGLVRDR